MAGAKDYVAKYMRKHIMYLQRNYQMMVGNNAYSLLRGAYLLKKATTPSAQIEQYNPGSYNEYAMNVRVSQSPQGQAWDAQRTFLNPEVPKRQRLLVRKYARALYSGTPSDSALTQV